MSAVMPDAQGLPGGRPEPVESAPLKKLEPRATSSVSPAPDLSPAERLEASRARLRGALMEIARPTPASSSDSPIGDWGDKLLRMARDLPGASIIIDSVESWWAQHPLRTAGVVAREASHEFIMPLARRSPFALLIGATVIGALFAASRPWRWLIRPALFVGLVPQLASHALRRMPIDSWLHMVSRFAGKPKSAAVKRPVGEPDPSPSVVPTRAR